MKKLFLMLFLSFLTVSELSQAAASKLDMPSKDKDTVSYYSALKLLRSRALRENQKLGTVFFGPHQTIWQKIKRDLVDKELRRKAFIKDGELVVSHNVLEELETQVTTKTKSLVQAQGKKQDRMISTGYAESRIRDMLRRAGYRDTKETEIIMRDVEKSIKRIIGKNKRIALSKLEELTLAAMKHHKENQKSYAKKDLSRLAAEVKILRAIKKKKLSPAEEFTATDMMTDALAKQKSRRFSSESVDAIIEKTFKTMESKARKSSKPKAIKKQKASSKKTEQKRGKPSGKGRWGNEKRPSTKTTLG